jgi:formylmethanofuran dehydrogenase subunit D
MKNYRVYNKDGEEVTQIEADGVKVTNSGALIFWIFIAPGMKEPIRFIAAGCWEEVLVDPAE